MGAVYISKSEKYLYSQNIKYQVENINPYLANGSSLYIERRAKPLSKFSEMRYGNMPNDNGNLILSIDEKNKLTNENIGIQKFIKKFIGASDYIQGKQRYCLWIPQY